MSEPLLALARLSWRDAFGQKLKAGPVHFAAGDVRPIAHKSALFQSLRPDAKAVTVEVQHLNLRGASVDEGKQISRQWIQLHSVTQKSHNPSNDKQMQTGWPYKNTRT